VNLSSPLISENILEIAFRAVRKKQDTPASDLISLYHQYFTTAVPVAPIQPLIFERFSLIDPNVTLTVRSSTSGS
jgi:hypothetical protein